jgi:hypothetical protein
MPSLPSTQRQNEQDNDSQVIHDSDDDVIALSDDDTTDHGNVSLKKVIWTASEIQMTSGHSQSQSLSNPYRIGIADPSIRSIFLPPPVSNSSAGSSTSTSANKRTANINRKISPTKRVTGAK